MSARLVFVVLLGLAAAEPARAESFKSWAARAAREEREKDSKAAVASYGNALSLWKDSDGLAAKGKALCARSLLREKDGDDAGALSDLSACLAIDKKNAKGFHRRGLLQLKAEKSRPRSATSTRPSSSTSRSARRTPTARAPTRCKASRCSPARTTSAPAISGSSPPARRSPRAERRRASPPRRRPRRPRRRERAGRGASLGGSARRGAPAEEAPKPKPAKAKSSYYSPKYRDCLEALEACVEGGDSFGGCVRAAPNCDKKQVKGCCPAACLKAYQKSINRDRSEAQAYREHFAPDAVCGVPPKQEDED
ncbi:MAG: hypothetical protein M0D55_16630 [Elusimicrobiota bacterium]|nr:MAG: hypothetical protein M0D55_16630 [Elusimicrobiota bacterium]